MVDLLLMGLIPVADLEVLDFDASSPQYHMLIGRDIICRGVLTVDFSNRFTFSM